MGVCCEQKILLTKEQLGDMAVLFKVFADPTRIRILLMLLRSAACVGAIAGELGVTQPAVSYQLRVLKQAKLIRAERCGKRICYALADSHVETILCMAKDHLEEA